MDIVGYGTKVDIIAVGPKTDIVDSDTGCYGWLCNEVIILWEIVILGCMLNVTVVIVGWMARFP